MKNLGGFMIFWDYDTQWGADRSRSGGGPKRWGSLDFENTERLLELHAQFNIPACFAVVGAAALPGSRPYHDPAQIRRIHQAGHEVASHSFQHDWLPGLDRPALKETLTRSKAALEECIGDEVVSFVPPWNQPVDYLPRLSISLSERRQVRKNRTDLGRLCEGLNECGFRFSRISYRSWPHRLIEWICRRRIDRPILPESIGGIMTVRVNTPCGFAEATQRMACRCARDCGLAVAYGHPHSLTSEGPQGERHLTELFTKLAGLRDAGSLRVLLPRTLLASSNRTDPGLPDASASLPKAAH